MPTKHQQICFYTRFSYGGSLRTMTMFVASSDVLHMFRPEIETQGCNKGGRWGIGVILSHINSLRGGEIPTPGQITF